MWTRLLVCGSLLGAGCSDKAGGAAAKPPVAATQEPAEDRCVTAVDKVIAMLTRDGEPDTLERESAIAECRKRADDPAVACVVAAKDDNAVKECLRPKPQGEPIDQLDRMTEALRTYYFVHETFTDHKLGPTPARPCCQFASKKCPPEATADEMWSIVELDLTQERAFQYRLESTADKAVLEAIGDRDCDGKTITYRRELEMRSDGNMHITVVDPPGSDD